MQRSTSSSGVMLRVIKPPLLSPFSFLPPPLFLSFSLSLFLFFLYLSFSWSLLLAPCSLLLAPFSLPPFSFLPSPVSFLPSPFSFSPFSVLLSPFCFLFSPFSFLFSPFSFFLPPPSFLLSPVSFLLSPSSFLLSPFSFLLVALRRLSSTTCHTVPRAQPERPRKRLRCHARTAGHMYVGNLMNSTPSSLHLHPVSTAMTTSLHLLEVNNSRYLLSLSCRACIKTAPSVSAVSWCGSPSQHSTPRNVTSTTSCAHPKHGMSWAKTSICLLSDALTPMFMSRKNALKRSRNPDARQILANTRSTGVARFLSLPVRGHAAR